ncbi:MAG: glutamate-1-semialdehyde 2,1-aminomutase [Phycisphaerae bacterium]
MSELMAGRSTERSERCHKAARLVMPGGVSSPVRAFGAVGGIPRFMVKGVGPILTDVDGHDYIDYVCGWGPLILGHSDKRVEAAVGKAAAKSLTFGTPTELEAQLAELVVSRFESIDLVRFVNSGTEAAMSAVRLARAFTGRDRIIKCDGCYHGHADGLLVQAGSGTATLGQPSSPGVPAGTAADTLLMPFNDLEAAGRLFQDHGRDIAALLIEPIAGNMGLVQPADGYLQALRQLCDANGALLILDEVMTGFRVSAGGAQQLLQVKPDLTLLGKILGGGLPAAALGGRRDIMELLAPSGPVYQAGTGSGNPLAMAAGLATLQALGEPGVYDQLEQRSRLLAEGFLAAAEEAGVAIQLARSASMGCVFFSSTPVTDFVTARTSDTAAYGRYFHAMLDRGVYLPPSQFECFFVSAAHDAQHIERTIEVAEEVFAEIAADPSPT